MQPKINESIICAGFGGQGVMVLGKVLADAGMTRDLHITWLSSYGAEVRGGTAHSMIRIASEPVASPIVSDPDTAIIMNGPSLDKFENRITAGGLLILNTSLTGRRVRRKDIDVVAAPLTDEAVKLGNIRVANMIAAGIFAAKKGIFDKDALCGAIKRVIAGRESLIPINIKAVEKGMEIC
ncbi:MAG: 2-oxoacid:ferredoxin oxidoreductase subunit gamma [Candidatus Makaraimicrobium thalassicum]|nr:MAG: 2-oxoacid:ferredoxin oxidoreductase subunit gamma [Candidatus Omnitrophota bacterium]